MNILNDINSADSSLVHKPDMEQVQQEKHEYKLLGTYLYTRGLTLFGYNHFEDDIFRVEVKYGDTIHLAPIDGKLMPIDYESEKCVIDSRFAYFEALNYKTAKERVLKFKQGKIAELCNLRKPSKDGIKFW